MTESSARERFLGQVVASLEGARANRTEWSRSGRALGTRNALPLQQASSARRRNKQRRVARRRSLSRQRTGKSHRRTGLALVGMPGTLKGRCLRKFHGHVRRCLNIILLASRGALLPSPCTCSSPDDFHLQASGAACREALLIFLTFVRCQAHRCLGTRQREGILVVWVGFKLLHRSRQLGISQRRAEWFVRWTKEIVEANFVLMASFEGWDV